VIDVSAGRRLAELAPAAVPPLLAEGFDHQNVEACPDYLPRLKEFLAHVEASAAASQRGSAGAAVAAGAAAISGARVQQQGSASQSAGGGGRSRQ
jgi:hypothetical protein